VPDDRKIESFVLLKGRLEGDPRVGEFTFFLENEDKKQFWVTLRGWATDLSEKVHEFIKMYLHCDSYSLRSPIATVVCEYTPDKTARNKIGRDFKLLKFFGQGDLLKLSLSSFEQEQQQDPE
jgi:hypothetical protein